MSTGNIISVVNHKGGVGKTTSSINISAGLASMGRKILLVDLDPQSNASQSLGLQDKEPNIYTYLKEAVSGRSVRITPVNISDNLDIIPSTLDLSGAEIELSNEMFREYILENLLEPIKDKYDYVIIDCPPSLGLLTINALSASDYALIPLQAQYLALKGMTKLMEVIRRINKGLNKDLTIAGIFITQYNSRKILNRDILTSIKTHINAHVFKTAIRDNIALAEAPAQGLDIFRYQPNSNGAHDYMALCVELLVRLESK